ncbi:MAG TPA: MBL fold metallo-hydrolase [Bryobacteraceae bacterium]|nr:MBL fold metallo-hydrolase [Bryobacteraceae bacterium]
MLASGSSGNATLVATENTRILVDAGLSVRELTRRLALAGEQPERLSAVLITHEHCDHVGGLARLVRRHRIPVYVTHRTAPTLEWLEPPPVIETFQAGARFSVGDIEVDSFTIPHDAADPVGYCFHAEGIKIGLATDLGYVTESIRYHLRGTHCLLLESNHDVDMLKVGPYPWSVKQRVMSRMGHLSNNGMAEFLTEDWQPAAPNLILGHLSEHNNHPEIVRLAAGQALERRSIAARVVVAGQRQPSEAFQF